MRIPSTIHPFFALLLAAFLASNLACGGGKSEPANQISPQDYVAEVLQIMRENVITKYQVDWNKLEAEVTNLAASATSIRETEPALTKALYEIGTNHSFITTSDDRRIYVSSISCGRHQPIYLPESEAVGYLTVPGFQGNVEEAKALAEELQNEIRQQDNENLKGWIVDLRNNSGGNMYPMIAGIAPLLGDGIYGYFADADENITPFGFENGSAFYGDNSNLRVDSPYQLINASPKIAVLSNRANASSGEATMIAFKKVPGVRFFGEDSCGLSTGNRKFELSDGSSLTLTVVVDLDREMERYGESVSVDEVVSNELVMERAIEWIINE